MGKKKKKKISPLPSLALSEEGKKESERGREQPPDTRNSRRASPSVRPSSSSSPRSVFRMADGEINIDSLIQRLLEGETDRHGALLPRRPGCAIQKSA